eukprot:scaffold52094_cov48-Prasinocladus_malaysianus.AAC.2
MLWAQAGAARFNPMFLLRAEHDITPHGAAPNLDAKDVMVPKISRPGTTNHVHGPSIPPVKKKRRNRLLEWVGSGGIWRSVGSCLAKK